MSDDGEEEKVAQPLHPKNNNTATAANTSRLAASLKKNGKMVDNMNMNLEESEDVDGLIKWAKNLPDDVNFSTGGNSFYLNK